MFRNKYEETLIELLAQIYLKIPWRQVRTRKNPHDIFNHRVRSAARRGTLYQFVSKLCNYFSIQSLPFETQGLIEILRKNEFEVMKSLNIEHIPYCVRAIMRAQEMKKAKKEEEDETEDPKMGGMA